MTTKEDAIRAANEALGHDLPVWRKGLRWAANLGRAFVEVTAEFFGVDR